MTEDERKARFIKAVVVELLGGYARQSQFRDEDSARLRARWAVMQAEIAWEALPPICRHQGDAQ